MIDKTKWFNYSFYQQMGNIASELSRAIIFENRNNDDHKRASLLRLIELLDLTKEDPKNKKRLKELCRFKEVVADWYSGQKTYHVHPESLKSYAMQFAILAAKRK